MQTISEALAEVAQREPDLAPYYELYRTLLELQEKAREEIKATLEMADEEALATVRRTLTEGEDDRDRFVSSQFPMVRSTPQEGPPRKYNVVILLMESLSAEAMGAFGNPHGATPEIDRLIVAVVCLAGIKDVISDLLPVDVQFIVAQPADIHPGLLDLPLESEAPTQERRGDLPPRRYPPSSPVIFGQQPDLKRGRLAPATGLTIPIPHPHFPPAHLAAG